MRELCHAGCQGGNIAPDLPPLPCYDPKPTPSILRWPQQYPLYRGMAPQLPSLPGHCPKPCYFGVLREIARARKAHECACRRVFGTTTLANPQLRFEDIVVLAKRGLRHRRTRCRAPLFSRAGGVLEPQLGAGKRTGGKLPPLSAPALFPCTNYVTKNARVATSLQPYFLYRAIAPNLPLLPCQIPNITPCTVAWPHHYHLYRDTSRNLATLASCVT